ncbi:glucose 1-dehydrogenase [Hypoxylon crocopeplum]|nr:glucose 1-dehydrogenase [Hypoxylon crocopeplum]
MAPKRVLCGYGIDVDAVANWINTCDGSKQNPTNVSRGVYGATVGIDRLLKLFAKYNIKATWFTPAHSIESFPTQLAKVRDAGHEIGLHGYTHEYPSELSESQQRTVLVKSIEVLTEFCGKRPAGYTAPAWATSKELIPQLQEFGIVYDHSFMHHDFLMHFCPDSSHDWIETNHQLDPTSWMRPMSKIQPSKVVEVPANWHLDDWPPFQPVLGKPSHGYIDTEVIFNLWKQQFDFAYREYDQFVFPISIHPQVSGKPHVVLLHERMIEYINSFEGVEWMPMKDMAKEFLEGRIAGAEIEGGVDI